MNTITTTCIYCGSGGPFNDEHVFSAGLGGDDKRFLLKNLVCQVCNSIKFSALEAKFMRAGPDALGRTFMHPESKKSGGGKTLSAARFHPENVRVYIDDAGERPAEIGPGGQASLVPQFILQGNSLSGSGSDLDLFHVFVDELGELLALDILPVITKFAGADGATYLIQNHHWNSAEYVVEEDKFEPRPPRQCLWYFEDRNLPAGVTRHPKIYRRAAGQTMVESGSELGLAEFLTRLRRAYPSVKASAGSATMGNEYHKPVVKLNLPMEFGIHERVLAKIGLNFAIRTYGESYMRHPCFDSVKKAILEGDPPIPCAVLSPESAELDEGFKNLFAGTPPDRHMCMLGVQPNPLRLLDMIFISRLYGGAISLVHLAYNIPPPTQVRQVFWEVDYHGNVIEEYSDIQYFLLSQARAKKSHD